MRRATAVALMLAVLSSPAFAHGGQYKGPGDAGGPTASGGGTAHPPTNPGGVPGLGPGVPTAGGGTGTGPGPTGRGGSNPTAATGSPIDISDTYESWEFWWENNKDQY